MTKIKCISLQRSNLKDLAKAIQDFQNENNLVSKGSIPFSFPDGEVGVIMFYPYDEDIQLPKEQVGDSTSSLPTKSPKAPFKCPEKWKLEQPTIKQKNTLKKMGYSWHEINAINKFQASKLIGGEGNETG